MVKNSHYIAVLQALFVTFLWSTSWVLIKIGLKDMPALIFAGLRYTIAFFVLLFWIAASGKIHMIKKLSKDQWLRLSVLGILLYTLTQGSQFLGLKYLTAVQVSLFLNFTPLVVMVFASIYLGEKPTRLQLIGVALFIIGALSYFYPITSSKGQTMGFIIMSIGVLSNAASSILGRSLNKTQLIEPVIITVISMGIGGILLLATGLYTQGLPSLNSSNWTVIIWLAVVNTAFAFNLWNKTLQTLTAAESSVMNNTMLIQISLLAWIFMGESLSPKGVIGIVIAAAGAIMVQIKFRNKKTSTL